MVDANFAWAVIKNVFLLFFLEEIVLQTLKITMKLIKFQVLVLYIHLKAVHKDCVDGL